MGDECKRKAAKGQKALFYLTKCCHPYTGHRLDVPTFRFRDGYKEAIAEGELEQLLVPKARFLDYWPKARCLD